MRALRAAISKGASSQTIMDIQTGYDLGPDKVAEQVKLQAGLKNADIQKEQLRIKEMTKGADLTKLLDLHAKDEGISPGYSFNKSVDDKGVVTLSTVGPDGKPTGSTMQFGSEIEATRYLTQLAQDPMVAMESAYNKVVSDRATKAKLLMDRAELAIETAKIDADKREAAVKEIGDLANNPQFMAALPGEQQKMIQNLVYDPLGLDSGIGKPDRPEDGTGTEDDSKPETFAQKVGLRLQKEAELAKKKQESRQAKTDYYANFTVDMLSGLNMDEIRELERDADFLPPDVADAINKRIAFRLQTQSGLGGPKY
jgi:hypothetical protein